MSTDDASPLNPNPETGKDDDTAQAPSDEGLIAPDDLLPAHAIGATDPEDEEAIYALLAESPNAAGELAEFAALNRALLHSAEASPPSPGLRDRIRSALQSEPAATERHASAQRTGRSWRRLLQESWPWPRIAAAAVILLLVVTNIVSLLRINTLQEHQRLLTEQLMRHNEVLAVMVNSGVQETILPAAAQDSYAQATVRWLADRPVAVLFADHFPVLEPDQVYQLWLIRDDERLSGGLFTVDSHGFGALVIETETPLGAYDRMGITPEPAGGSPGPTSSPVVRGPL